jgi:hypothetical protein
MLRFGKIFIAAWILFTAFAAISLKFLYGGNWLAAILNGLFTGAVFGVILASVAFLLTRYLKFSRGVFILVLVLMSIAGITTSVLIYSILDSIPSTPWEMIHPTPPDKPVAFFGNSMFLIGGGAIYVKTDKSGLFSHECLYENPCEWKKLEAFPEQPEKSGYGTCQEGFEPHYRTPKTPPGKVIDKYVVNYCGADYVIQHNWVLLEDGSIWHWSRYHAAVEFILYVLIGIVGGITGTLSSFVLLVNRKSKETW